MSRPCKQKESPMTAPTTEQTSALASATPAVLEELLTRPAARPGRRAAPTTSAAQRAHTLLARLLLAALGLQIFFAGVALFGVSLLDTHGFTLHALFAPVVILGSISLPLLAWRGHLDRATARRSWLLFALMLVHVALIDL